MLDAPPALARTEPGGGPTAARAAARPDGGDGRDVRIDVLRALCIVSMTAGHLAAGTIVDRASHPLVWVDGAAGFVACSGLVLGRVQRKVDARFGSIEAHRRLLRRAAMIWSIHVALCVVALTAREVAGTPAFFPTVAALGGPVRALSGIATLQVQPDYLNVLPLYVLLLLAANGAVFLLRNRLGALCLALSVAAWGWTQVGTHLDGAPQLWQSDTTFRVGAWQLLFVGGLVAGWHWNAVRSWCEDRRRTLVPAALGLTVALALLGQAVRAGWSPSWFEPAFEKYRLRPGVVVYALLAAIACYWVAGRLPHGPIWRGLARLGSRSLDCFVVLSAAQLLVFCFRPAARSTLESALEVAVVLLLDAALVGWRRRAKGRRAVPPAASDPSAAADHAPYVVPAPLPTPLPALASSR